MNRSVLDVLKPYCNAAVLLDFGLDNGIPYPRNSSARLKVLLTDTVPESQSDPEKPIRAAGFAGWIVAPTEPADAIPAYITEVGRHIEEVNDEQD
jgi:hypothetical protein